MTGSLDVRGGLFGGFAVFALLGRSLLHLRLRNALVELVNAARGIDELLLSGIERMAVRTNLDGDLREGGTGGELIAAGTRDLRVGKPFRVDLRFHSPPIIASVARGSATRRAIEVPAG